MGRGGGGGGGGGGGHATPPPPKFLNYLKCNHVRDNHNVNIVPKINLQRRTHKLQVIKLRYYYFTQVLVASLQAAIPVAGIFLYDIVHMHGSNQVQ